MKTAVSKSIRPMPRPTEKRMGELRERAKETVEMDRLEKAITDGTEAKSLKQDYKATQDDLKTSKKSGRIIVRASGGKNPGANLKPIVKKAGGMVGYKNGGCVMAGRGGNFQGEM